LYEAIRRGKVEILGRDESLASRSERHPLSSLIQVQRRPPSLTVSSLPFSQRRSPAGNEASARDVVVERRWSWSSVTESDELVGRMSLVSRLPQYLSCQRDRE